MQRILSTYRYIHQPLVPALIAEIAQLSEQILDALVDEHGKESQDGFVRAWLRKRRGGNAE
jgi:hypothetical protein